MPLEFEWDDKEASSNLRKHGVAFDEAVAVFSDARSLTIDDPDHSQSESRYITIGTSAKGKLIVVVATDRSSRIRIISARRATKRERRMYEESDPKRSR